MSNFTETIILNTFDQLLEAMPFEKITVSAIIKGCGISRNTFYYHYQDIYDLLDAWLQNELGKYGSPAAATDWDERMKEMLHACRQNKRKVYHLYNSISRGRIEQYVFTSTNDLIYDYVSQRAEGKAVSPTRVTALADICRYALIGFFLRFLWNGMNDDIDTSVNELSILFNDIVERSLEER
ncbi:MAG: TetR/AcrR family transcriptional regulator C-terminal domain-containing protein [Oscillospiraceae bacterium]|nr:TetR/AcrR family transcriptional regulator C-terminal domain-containing protein [Oscillospiraceae bacterium]